MKTFLKNTSVFIFILYGSLLLLLIVSNSIVNSRANFSLKPNINKVVIGNSHPAGTFNDSLISNFKNFADPGENYFYGYQKIKQLLKQNPQIDTVYVEFNPKTILIREDEKLWKKHQIPNYQVFFDFKDHQLFAKSNPLGYQQELLLSIKANLNRILFNNYNFIESNIGGYRFVKSSHINAILDTLSYDPKKQVNPTKVKFSENDMIYLNRLIELCHHKNIQPIFVRSPYHKMFDARKYEDLFQAFRKKHFAAVPFMDFQDFPIEDSEFSDLRHLNYFGASKFSKWFEDQKMK